MRHDLQLAVLMLCRGPSVSFGRAFHIVLRWVLKHLRLRTVYYWTLVLGQVAAALASTTKRQPLFGSGDSCWIHLLACSMANLQSLVSDRQYDPNVGAQIPGGVFGSKALMFRRLRVSEPNPQHHSLLRSGAEPHGPWACNSRVGGTASGTVIGCLV